MGEPGSGRQPIACVDRFQILSELGRGGMGVVYLARDPFLGRDVAIKLPTGDLQLSRLARLQREAAITAKLDHPGIVRIHGAGLYQKRPYLAYELVEGGRSLREVLGEVELGERLELILQAADALGYAHGQGVVHRDVKPENLLVDDAGRVKVADFGLATAEGVEALTRAGAALGSLVFLAPEVVQFGARDAKPAADVWALGIVLYQALTGELPFRAQTVKELAEQMQRGVPAPRSRVPEVDPALEAVCLGALRLRAGKRYSDGDAFAAALRAAIAEEPAAAAPGEGRRAAVAGAAVGAALIALVLVATLVRGSRSDPGAAPAQAAQPAGGAPESDALAPATTEPATVGGAAAQGANAAEAEVLLAHAREQGQRRLAFDEVWATLERASAAAPPGSPVADAIGLERGELCRRRGRYARSEAAARTLLDREGDVGLHAHWLLGHARRALGDQPGSREVFAALAELDPAGAYGLCAQASLSFGSRRGPRSLDLLREALALAPQHVPARRLQGFLLAFSPEGHTDGLRVLRALVAEQPDDADLYRLLALVQPRDPEAAAQALRRAVDLAEPSPPTEWLSSLGVQRLQAGQAAEAALAFDRAVELEASARDLLWRGVAHDQRGKAAKAQADWTAAHALDADDCLRQLGLPAFRDYRSRILDALGLPASAVRPAYGGWGRR